MKKHYSIAEARQGLPAIVHEVERGGTACITRRGHAVAHLVSAAEFECMQFRRKEPDWNLFSLDLRDFKSGRGEANSRWAIEPDARKSARTRPLEHNPKKG